MTKMFQQKMNKMFQRKKKKTFPYVKDFWTF